MKLLLEFSNAQQERLQNGGIAGKLGWLTIGMSSGMLMGNTQRGQQFFGNPSVYNLMHWTTMGFGDTVKGAVVPKEPLSLEHWLNSLGVVAAAGIYKGAARRVTVAQLVDKTPRVVPL